MPTTKPTHREFTQNVSRIKHAARDGPVEVSGQSKPTDLMLSQDADHRLAGSSTGIRELLDQPGVDAIEFDPPAIGKDVFRIPDLA